MPVGAVLLILTIALSAACGGVLKTEYEYEEELYLSLDGSGTLNVNASIPALVALRGAELNVDPSARLDREKVRAIFQGPGLDVSRVSTSRRDGRRFVHVSIDFESLQQLTNAAPFAWSTYRLERAGEVVRYQQMVGASAGRRVGDVGWDGDEVVAFRMHIPSEIPWHNAEPGNPKRGNIVEWEQGLSERLAGTPLDLRVDMEPDSILYSTLILFASTIVAAAAAFALAIWWIVRRGATARIAESQS